MAHPDRVIGQNGDMSQVLAQGMPLPDLPRIKTPAELLIEAQSMDFANMTGDQFRLIRNGYIEEAGIMDRKLVGDRPKQLQFRLDFPAELTEEQKSVGRAVNRMISSDRPIPRDDGISLFSYIRSKTSGREDPQILRAKFEAMQKAAQEHKGEPNSEFWKFFTNIGQFEPAVLYDVVLDEKAKKIIEASKPVEPEPVAPKVIPLSPGVFSNVSDWIM